MGAEQEDRVAEAQGESLGEAKWAAVKELEPRFPGLTAECVSFEVLDEATDGEGQARVRAAVDTDAWRKAAEEIPEEPAERVRAVVARVVHSLGLRGSVDIEESDEEIRATVNGDDLGLLIGKHGLTIDALQHLAFRAAFRRRGCTCPTDTRPPAGSRPWDLKLCFWLWSRVPSWMGSVCSRWNSI